MSVLKAERKTSRMEVQLKAIDIAAYTFQKVSNENVIAKRHRWSIGQKMLDVVLQLCNHIDVANTLDLKDSLQREQRQLNQRLAKADMLQLMTLIEIANKMKKNLECYEYWTQLVVDEQNLLNGWIESDKHRSAN